MPNSTEAPQTKTPRIADKKIGGSLAAIVAGLCIGSAAYLLLQLANLGQRLDSTGQEGDHHAQVWGLVVAILSLAVSLIIGVLQLLQARHAPHRSDSSQRAVAQNAHWQIKTRHIALTILVAATALFLPPAVSKYVFWHWQTEDITAKIQVSRNDSMYDGSKAYVTLPATRHRHLTITFRLSSQLATGSCVAPARMTITPQYGSNDGQDLAPIFSNQQQVVTFKSDDSPNKLQIALDLSEEPTCVVKLSVQHATYYE